MLGYRASLTPITMSVRNISMTPACSGDKKDEAATSQAKKSSVPEHWEEENASASEATVKADKAEVTSVQELQELSVKTIKGEKNHIKEKMTSSK
ncbi:hypothetical protein F751_4595 [Auxenochlorella protothecoides]|uniref:Uncharacterized protein n=1 Tax=Auxenochlorella protothecoides TaxID=3075 RepID=A0A087SNM1_AUXPR|nr:hypothetical protein F751_4595 [Auxenochlorella protothecoides]KFM27325.1 hypothetical protein F751_4595 [Auxenochlorella protothecoides]RMZ57502.1 hypothetical protein APUTEX25_003745 [Auxenochlorella protothecoides]|eukprot:RMZ57502.1 hypothetical protein APUTEX25_003745 [Auxenochlorella protothecoides]